VLVTRLHTSYTVHKQARASTKHATAAHHSDDDDYELLDDALAIRRACAVPLTETAPALESRVRMCILAMCRLALARMSESTSLEEDRALRRAITAKVILTARVISVYMIYIGCTAYKRCIMLSIQGKVLVTCFKELWCVLIVRSAWLHATCALVQFCIAYQPFRSEHRLS
jgi:hypothetical protein